MNVNKVLLAEPIYQALPPAVYSNRIMFWNACYGMKDIFRVKALVMGPRRSIRSARHIAVENAVMDHKCTHLFFLDDDIAVPADILFQLLAADKPVVGGLIHRDDGCPIVFRDPRPTDDLGAINAYLNQDVGELTWTHHPAKGLFECAAVGAGCMLIKVEVLNKLQESNRFLFNYDETGRSMDVRFCRMARDAGFSVWCWPDVPCQQVKHYPTA